MKRQPTRLIKTTVHHHTRNKFTINPYPFDLIVICVCYPEHPVHLICANIQRILQPGSLPRSVNVTKNRAAFTDNRPHGTGLNINFAHGRRAGIDAIQTVKEQGQATWLRKCRHAGRAIQQAFLATARDDFYRIFDQGETPDLMQTRHGDVQLAVL